MGHFRWPHNPQITFKFRANFVYKLFITDFRPSKAEMFDICFVSCTYSSLGCTVCYRDERFELNACCGYNLTEHCLCYIDYKWYVFEICWNRILKSCTMHFKGSKELYRGGPLWPATIQPIRSLSACNISIISVHIRMQTSFWSLHFNQLLPFKVYHNKGLGI